VIAGRRAVPVLVAVLAVAGCASTVGTDRRARELVVASRPDSESVLLADIYAGALRSYGFATRTESATDPLTKLDSGDVDVVPGFTGQLLQVFSPGAAVRSDQQVYRTLVGVLPEGVAAGDYATAAEDKPALAVTRATAKAWGGNDLSEVPRHCDGLVVGSTAGARTPAKLSRCQLPAAHEFVNDAAMFAALQAGRVAVAWTTTAAPDVPADVVVLADGKPALVQAENVVPLYRRNALSDRQVLAVNEVAGVLDTAALADLRRQVMAGGGPQAVADAWLADHPLGR
jgi:glycine betaine/choline ABC-type transport system substrate-binding protein